MFYTNMKITFRNKVKRLHYQNLKKNIILKANIFIYRLNAAKSHIKHVFII